MNALYLTVDGVVGTEPRRALVNGQPLLSFRMVSNERRFDSATQAWVDVHSSWLSVSCFRAVARNAAASIKKGDRVIVHGKVRVKDYVTATGERRTSVDVEATSLGHDLRFGTSRYEPARAAETTDDHLREQADLLLRELAELPQESVDELLAQRAALVARAGLAQGSPPGGSPPGDAPPEVEGECDDVAEDDVGDGDLGDGPLGGGEVTQLPGELMRG